MACNKCGQTAANLKTDQVNVWVKRCGKNEPPVRACAVNSSGKAVPALGVSNITDPNEGAITFEYAIDCEDNCKRVKIGETQGDPDQATVDITINKQCGGYDITQLTRGRIDLYFEYVCCCSPAATFAEVENYGVLRGVTLRNGTLNTLTTLTGEAENVQYTFSGRPHDGFLDLYKLESTKVFESDAPFFSGIFIDPPASCEVEDDCKDRIYAAIDLNGDLWMSNIPDADNPLTVPGLPATASRFWLTQVGSKLYVWYSSAGLGNPTGYVCVTLDENCIPQDNWISGPVINGLIVRGVCASGSEHYVYGLTAGGGAIYTVDGGGNVEQVLLGPSPDIRKVGKCGNTVVATGSDGGIYKQKGCVGVFEQLDDPTGGAAINGVDVLGPNTFYIVDGGGNVFCTTNCVATPMDTVASVQVGANGEAAFYDSGIGVIVGSAATYHTGTEGSIWSDSFIEHVPGFAPQHVEWDCDDPNCLYMLGTEGGAGCARIWKPANCS